MTQIRLHNTKTRKKEVFTPLDPRNVRMYVCGPTVYDRAHLGNARPVVVFDVLYRLLRHVYGADHVTYVRNITDIDDKINARAAETGRDIGQITAETTRWYLDDMKALGALDPDEMPRATQWVPQMIAMIETLIAKGHAYAAEGHVLFAVDSYAGYGALSGRSTDDMIAGARVEVAPYKRNPMDFVLWKPSTPDLPGWDSPWGRGRPGWHIECSAMAGKHLGRTIDIHAGGQDLVFPHHENELAQSRCAHDGEEFARFWLHNGFLSVDHEKMSKSLGNVVLVHELIRSYPGEVLRLALMSAHYRQPLDWSTETIDAARRMLDRLYGAVRGIDVGDDARAAAEPPAALVAALEDDINTPKAMAELFGVARQLNKARDVRERERLAASMFAAGGLLGILQQDAEAWFAGDTGCELSPDAIDALLAERQAAREQRDFGTADRIRDRLAAAGIQIEDGPDGTVWRRST